MTIRTLLLAAGAAALLVGCLGPEVDDDDVRHIVMYDRSGTAIDARDRTGPLWSYDELDAYAAHVEDVMDGIRASGKDRVLLFVHGGLNEQDTTIERARDLWAEIEADGAYPIFVNWQSNLVSSYRDHLLFVRRGQDWGGWGIPVAPFQLLADLGRGLSRLPGVVATQLAEVAALAGIIRLDDRIAANRGVERLQRDMAAAAAGEDAHALQVDARVASRASRYGSASLSVLLSPIKLATLTAVDVAGTGAWDVMRRRVAMLFDRDDAFDGKSADRPLAPFALLLAALHDLQHEYEEQGRPLTVDAVSHSTGALVVNRILTEAMLYGHANDPAGACGVDGCRLGPGDGVERTRPVPALRHIVYMAAACTIRDYEDAVFPYLMHEGDARAFHVMLHPDDELAESNAFNLAPSGSLLVWIDDFLDNPVSLLDRRAGRYDNLAARLSATPRGVRGRVFVRVLPEDDPTLPREHGQFTSPRATRGHFRFWRPTSWWAHWGDGLPLPVPATLPEP